MEAHLYVCVLKPYPVPAPVVLVAVGRYCVGHGCSVHCGVTDTVQLQESEERLPLRLAPWPALPLAPLLGNAQALV